VRRRRRPAQPPATTGSRRGAGFSPGTISLTALDATTYPTIRLRATLTGARVLRRWEVFARAGTAFP